MRVSYIVFFVTVLIFTPFCFINAAEQSKVSTAPVTNNGKKWRIGYIEGGSYRNYQLILKALISKLADMGWIEKKVFPETPDEKETRTIWLWLSADIKSKYLDFVSDAYWTAGWNLGQREKNKKNIIKRLNNNKDIDLMLAFGTWAGLNMSNNLHSVPTMVLSSSDPIRAGIVKSAEDSGFDHIHAQLDPKRYERQIRLFYDIVKFKKLGVSYQISEYGRTYAAIDGLGKVAKELDFELIECPYPRQPAFSQEEKNMLLKCHRKLAPEIDAFYITVHSGVNLKNLPALLTPFFKHKVPTFAQSRTGEVKYGALMSLADRNFQDIAEFSAETFAKILNGAKPRELPQVYEEHQEIAINLETAKKIGFRFPLDILAGAKEIYEHIENVDDAD